MLKNSWHILLIFSFLACFSGCKKDKELFDLVDNFVKLQENKSKDPPPHKVTPKEHAKTSKERIKSADKATGLIMITADTLRADYLSCYGNEEILTPYLDRLAGSGVLFRQAITAATTTTPSHASMFTSLYLQDHNAYSNYEAIADDVITLFEQVHGRGFRTFAIVNMPHLNPEVSNIVQGVETFYSGNRPRRAHDTMKIFLNWLDGLSADEPFLAWLHLVDVHTPYRPPAPYNRFYYAGDENDPQNHSLQNIWPLLPTHMSDHPFFKRWLEGITDLSYVLAQYKGAVSYLDDEMGELFKELEARGRLDDTAIIFASDHGESLGEHDMYFIHFGLYEPTLRVPLIMYLPGAERSGVVVDQVVETIDIMPTILEYFAIPNPPNIRGKSLLPVIRGELTDGAGVAYSEHAGASLAMVRDSRYKYIRHLKMSSVVPAYNLTRGREELYDLEKDPLERHDIITEYPEIAEKYRRIMREKRRHKLNIHAGEPTINKETEAMLKSLGYIR